MMQLVQNDLLLAHKLIPLQDSVDFLQEYEDEAPAKASVEMELGCEKSFDD
ncbi:unnamed protein product [Haemonchus placei]|uniref:Uncharacterized protein n=1 Tax=Haemonchus placei TaxID=6290 RepID=A0A3P8CX79_HAEPC|nr:unnamed protein product [Haemonchus placei]